MKYWKTETEVLRAPFNRSLYGPGHQPGNSKVDLLAEMVAPKVDFGPLGVPRGPKSHFLVKSQHKITKKSIQEGFQKKHEN